MTIEELAAEIRMINGKYDLALAEGLMPYLTVQLTKARVNGAIDVLRGVAKSPRFEGRNEGYYLSNIADDLEKGLET